MNNAIDHKCKSSSRKSVIFTSEFQIDSEYKISNPWIPDFPEFVKSRSGPTFGETSPVIRPIIKTSESAQSCIGNIAPDV